ncbi:hypothetical protein AGOR_G00001200 [Albula goreensis]|uniref:Uncharacterized protein n=1 Tax=Albula goreensis TaxID=1534307 RepID=A0A8T3E3Y8_9TELE|nr:hypothetical protein AGOR_G00001200 [Albula goreensis]
MVVGGRPSVEIAQRKSEIDGRADLRESVNWKNPLYPASKSKATAPQPCRHMTFCPNTIASAFDWPTPLKKHPSPRPGVLSPALTLTTREFNQHQNVRGFPPPSFPKTTTQEEGVSQHPYNRHTVFLSGYCEGPWGSHAAQIADPLGSAPPRPPNTSSIELTFEEIEGKTYPFPPRNPCHFAFPGAVGTLPEECCSGEETISAAGRRQCHVSVISL